MDDTDIAGQVDRAFGRYRFRRAVNELAPGHRRAPAFSARWVSVPAALLIAVAAWALSATPAAVGPTLAFVGWSTVPSVPDASFATVAAERCGVDASMSLEAQDQRGNAAALVFARGQELTLCLIAKDDTGAIVAAASGSTHLEQRGDPLSVDTALSAPASTRSQGVRVLAGRASPPIASVHVTRSDGVQVAATLSSGYWVAWWPTTVRAATVTSEDAGGAVVQVEAAPN